MIIDVHCHTPTHREEVPPNEKVVNTTWRPDQPVVATTTYSDFDRAQKEGGVDVSIVFNIAVRQPTQSTGLPVGSEGVNDSTAAFVSEAPRHRVGFLSVHPEDPAVMDEIERCVDDLGLKGIKLAPNYQQYDPLSDQAALVYAEAEKRGLPILFHQGTSAIPGAPLRFAHPLIMDEIAARYPQLRIVMAHLGHPWQNDTIAVVRKHPHVYADISAGYFRVWSFYSAMRIATEWDVLDKLLFGSDYPIGRASETLEGLRAVNDVIKGTALPSVPLEDIEGIIHRNALEVLGIDV